MAAKPIANYVGEHRDSSAAIPMSHREGGNPTVDFEVQRHIIGLPYIYKFSSFMEVSFREPISKWVGDPLWIYVVPTEFVSLL